MLRQALLKANDGKAQGEIQDTICVRYTHGYMRTYLCLYVYVHKQSYRYGRPIYWPMVCVII